MYQSRFCLSPSLKYLAIPFIMGLLLLLPGLAMADFSISKTASPGTILEPGGAVSFTVQVTNLASQDLTLSALVDDLTGDLNGEGSCTLPQTITPGNSYSCSFTVQIQSDATPIAPLSFSTTATANLPGGSSATMSDNALVFVQNVDPTFTLEQTPATVDLNEPGGSATFQLDFTNTSVATDPLSVLAPTFGGAGTLVDTDCEFQIVEPGTSYSCQYTVEISAPPGDLTVSATVQALDNEATDPTETVSSTVTIVDAPPSIAVTQTPDTASVTEPGGTVDFSLQVENTSGATDPVTVQPPVITPSADVVSNDCYVDPAVLAPGESISCQYSVAVSGNVGETATVGVSVEATDDDGSTTSGSDSSTVSFDDAAPSLAVTQTPDTTTVDDPGGTVTVAVDITNNSVSTDPLMVEPPQIVTDGTATGTLQSNSCPSATFPLASGDSLPCEYVLLVSGDTADSLTATVNLSAVDDEGTPATASASDEITVVGTDYGDAPDTFATLLESDGARHNIVPGFMLGALIDSEANGIPGMFADGDDTTELADEDGVVLLEPLVPGLASDLEITGPEGGVVDAWMDFNGNGNWNDPGEQVIVAAPLGAAPTTLSVTVPVGTVSGPIYARFRLSEAGVALPTGAGGNGEVEDYLYTIEGVGITVTKDAIPLTITEPGEDVSFTVVVINDGTTPFELVNLEDSLYGNINERGSCDLPQIVNPGMGGRYECAFNASLTGNAGDEITNVVVASAQIRDLLIEEQGEVTVTVNDAPPTIAITQTPVDTSIPEPGGVVSFVLQVDNLSGATDPVAIDPPDVDPGASGVVQSTDCVATVVAPGESYTCGYDVLVAGNVGQVVTVDVTVTGSDDEMTPVSDTASSQVTFSDAQPSLALTLDPASSMVEQPGGLVAYTLTVSNTSVLTDPLDIVITTITATPDGEGTATVQNSASCDAGSMDTPAGTDFQCTFEVLVENALVGDSVDVAVAASGTDDEDNTVSDTASALINVTGTDYGDAPDSYATTAASGGASHVVMLDYRLGEFIDAEADGLPSDNADGDDLNAADNDEDGVSLLSPLIPGLSADLEVLGPENGILDAWVDFNANGNWDDEGEHVIVAAALTGTADTLSLAVPATATSGPTYARFRLSETGLESPGGAAGRGEVEDYVVIIESLGLAVSKTATPDTLPEPGGDVSFDIAVENTSTVPVELTSLDDDIFGDLNGQGDCVLPQTLMPEGIYSCAFTGPVIGIPDATITNIVVAVATIDTLQISAEDSATVTIQGLAPTLSVVQLPETASIDEPGGLLPFTLEVTNTSSVSDPVTIQEPVVNSDGVVSDSTCAAVTILPGDTYSCGYNVTVEGNVGTLFPIEVVVSGSDDEGVPVTVSATSQVDFLDVFPTVELTQTPAEALVDQAVGQLQLTVMVTNTSVASDPITLDSITPNPVGDATGTVLGTDCVAGTEVLSGASYSCTYDLQVDGQVGQSLDADLDLVFSDDDGNQDTASTSSLVTVTGTDHGDAPDPYPTLVEAGGPTHMISPDFYLGALVDAEADGLPTAGADGDDLDNLADEDGITFLEPLVAGSVVSLQAMVANEEGSLSAWIDFNLDGDWDDPGEQVLMDQGAGPGSTTLDIQIPAQATPGDTFARFRLTRAGGVGVGGPAPDGEVEDYAVNVAAAYDLVLAKDASPNPLGLDQLLTYTFSVANFGPNDASGGTITDVLPAGVAFFDSEDGCVDNAGTITCPVGPVTAGDLVQISFQAEVTDFTLESIENAAVLVSNEADADPENNQASVVVTLDLIPPTVDLVNSVEDTGDGMLDFCETARVPVTQLLVGFSEAMAETGDGSVTLADNYRVIAAGPDQDIGTFLCGDPQGDDVAIAIDGVSYDPTTDTATLSLNGATPLMNQPYMLLACPGLTDAAGNPLDGDDNGVGGEEYVFQFRAEQDNLFDNGNLDCSLAGWIRGTMNTDLLAWVSDDVDGALISGSAAITLSSPNFILNQCVSVTGGERYTIAAQAQVDSDQPVPITGRCDFYDQAACGGNFISRSQGTDPVEDTAGDWVLAESSFFAPGTAVSARCGYVVNNATSVFDLGLDQLLLRLGGPSNPLLFSNGFD